MDEELYNKLLEAAGSAFRELFARHDEHYYYCTLVTTGDGACPYISAWSHEALARFMEESHIPEEERRYYEWSYADSPYCAFGWEHFHDTEQYVNRRRPSAGCGIADWNGWLNLLLDTMERVMRELDAQGVFGSGSRRDGTLINAEVMPPDYSNTQRALRLNREENIRVWLEEAAEPEGDQNL